jgi:1,4-dihydroxy-2-naphthoate polyprenyltransferase
MAWGRVKGMILLARPLVIVAGLLAFSTGACMAYWRLGMLPLAETTAGLAIMVSAIVMGHYANEYADFDTDSVTRRTLFSGGSGILPAGVVPRSWALYAAVVFLGITASLTLACYALGLINWSVVLLVAIGVTLGWFYSMPPLRLERTWLGELDNALLGTMMFLIGYMAPTGGLDLEVIAVSIPIFLAVLVNLLAVHYVDRRADEIVGKRTMAVVLGQRTIRLFAFLVGLLYFLSLPLMVLLPIPVVICFFATVPVALWAIRGFIGNGGPQYGSFFMGSFLIFIAIGFILA